MNGEVAQAEQSPQGERTHGSNPGPLHHAYGIVKDGRLMLLTDHRPLTIMHGWSTATVFCRLYKGERVVPLPYAGPR